MKRLVESDKLCVWRERNGEQKCPGYAIVGSDLCRDHRRKKKLEVKCRYCKIWFPGVKSDICQKCRMGGHYYQYNKTLRLFAKGEFNPIVPCPPREPPEEAKSEAFEELKEFEKLTISESPGVVEGRLVDLD